MSKIYLLELSNGIPGAINKDMEVGLKILYLWETR